MDCKKIIKLSEEFKILNALMSFEREKLQEMIKEEDKDSSLFEASSVMKLSG